MEKGRIRKSISLISLWPVLLILKCIPVLCSNFWWEREKGKNSAKPGHLWCDEMHAWWEMKFCFLAWALNHACATEGKIPANNFLLCLLHFIANTPFFRDTWTSWSDRTWLWVLMKTDCRVKFWVFFSFLLTIRFLSLPAVSTPSFLMHQSCQGHTVENEKGSS